MTHPATADSDARATRPLTAPMPDVAIVLALIVVVLLGAILRIWRLDVVPPAINQDEAVHAYDAWCLLQTGHDHDGAPWPIFLRAFGDYHPAPFVYLLIPFQALMGLSVWSARLPAAIVGTLAIPLVYLLLRRRYGAATGLVAAAMTAVSPWHIHLNRLALEAGICPTLILGGLVALDAARPARSTPAGSERLRQLSWLALSGAIFGLTTWTYHAMRVFVPLLLVGLALTHARPLRDLARHAAGRLCIIAWAGGLLVGLMPFLAAWAVAPQQAWARATTVSAIDISDGAIPAIRDILLRYVRHFSPEFLFLRGDPSLIQSVPDYGQLHFIALLLVPLGLVRVLRRWRTERFGRLLLWWMLIGPVPSALAYWPGGHSLRSVGSLPVYDMLAAIGLCGLIAIMAGRSRRAAVVTAVACGLAVTVNTGFFLQRFFVEYPVKAAPAFESEWRKVFAAAQARQADFDFVMFTTLRTNQLAMLYLFWTKLDPAACQRAEIIREPFGIVDRIVLIDRVVFQPSAVLMTLSEQPGAKARVLVAERPEIPVAGEVLERFFYPDGREAVTLYDVRINGGPQDDAQREDEPDE